MNARATDFLCPPGTPRAGWMLLLIGAACVAAALWFDRQWASEREATERAARAADATRRERERPKPAPAPTMAQLRWQQAQVELRRPWISALRAVESATVDPVYLLSLAIDPSTGAIKLEGEAPSFDHALAYVQNLDDGGALQPATVASHEQAVEPGSGRPFVHFTATTRWNAQ
jgi:hypothetical protein